MTRTPERRLQVGLLPSGGADANQNAPTSGKLVRKSQGAGHPTFGGMAKLSNICVFFLLTQLPTTLYPGGIRSLDP
jgi:hypothetical protein